MQEQSARQRSRSKTSSGNGNTNSQGALGLDDPCPSTTSTSASMSPPKSCAVCGDKALGYNFNAVTCESCKAFFRRNALAKKQFSCPFSQNCDITVITRRFCQRCRLKKCLDIGMKSENIMSDEDKMIKRRKIESNRAKRKLNEQKDKGSGRHRDVGDEDEEHERAPAADSSGCDAYSGSQDSRSCGSFESSTSPGQGQPSSSTPTGLFMKDSLHDINPELMTGEEMVEFIVCDPDSASQAISRLMRTPKEALSTLEKILSSQKEALRLISHLIAYPGHALKIISQLMNSPFNALTVFTKFMSSPTDALEIISKVVSSPQDVLQFIRNLMDSPEDALHIMNSFMNTPAEALRIINKIFNGSNPLTTPGAAIAATATDVEVEVGAKDFMPPTAPLEPSETSSFRSPIAAQTQEIHSSPPPHENTLIYSMLNNSSPGGGAHGGGMLPLQNLPATPQSMASPYAPSPPQVMASMESSPVNNMAAASELQYHSPSTSRQQTDELPSTSEGLISNSPANFAADTTDFASEHFDIKTFIQNSFPQDSSAGAGGDGINSLESVLTEVIRIEFQAFNNLPSETRVKQEQHAMHMLPGQHLPNQSVGCRLLPQQQQHLLHQQQQQPICAPSSALMGRDLNEMELQKLRELKMASEALYYPVDEDLSVLMMGDDRIKPEDTRQDPKLLQVINLTAVAIKRLIKMAKKITAFRDMCQEDQVALLKGGCTEMMIMRSVMTYDDDRNTWKIPHTKEDMSNIRAEVLKLAKGNVYEEHLKFIRTFDEKWRRDENIILIMCAIVLFAPARPRIIHSDVIRLEQNSYYYLLRRYLESVYPGCEAKSAFIKLIQKISDVERLNQFIIGVYLNVNPSQVEPLLREIFDLKNY